MLSIKCYPTLEAMRHVGEVRGKFVQIRWKGAPWLLVASKDQHAFHNQIVAHFLSEQHIPFHWRSPEVLEFDYPEMNILGGGKFQLDWQAGSLHLSDNSMVYGRFDEEALGRDLETVGLPWRELAITIR